MRAKLAPYSVLMTLLSACSSGEDTGASGFTGVGPTTMTPTTQTTPATPATEDTGEEPTGGGQTDSATGGPSSDPSGDPSGDPGPGETGETGLDDTGHGVSSDVMTTGSIEPPVPSCDDGIVNQDETDVDCGGATCPVCGLGDSCQADGDCETDSCIMGECTTPSCSDGAKNGDETDVDCGGGCNACGDNQGCVSDDDCTSEVCQNEVCSPPSCGDGVQNGNETEVDCGGGCMGCGEGQMCEADTDCLSNFCNNGACAPKDCDTNADCGQFNSACTTGVCTPQKKCQAQNANEGGGCDDGNPCMTGEKCSAGVCGGAVAKDCSAMSGTCALGVCDMGSGNCTAQPANEGNPCNDNNTCTVGEVCSGGSCKDPVNPNGYVFYETFANNQAGWTLGTEWGIAGATASAGQEQLNPDPGTDHTPSGDNGVAGVVIGGNATTSVHDFYFLVSPPVDTTTINGTVFLSFWHWLNSDFQPYMDNHIDVWNGGAWTTLYAGPVGNFFVNDTWVQSSFDVTAYKNAGFKFRVGHKVGNSAVYVVSSWNLDDVVIGPAVCTPL